MKKSFMVELRFNNINKDIFKTLYIKNLIRAEDKETACNIVLEKYRPYYDAGDKGTFEIGANWLHVMPTFKIVKEFKDKVIGKDDTVIRMHPGSEGLHHFSRIKNDEDLKEEWQSLNFGWGEVYYFDGAYHVPLEIYGAVKDCIIKSFPGTTKETYDKALKFLEDNTFKQNLFKYHLLKIYLERKK